MFKGYSFYFKHLSFNGQQSIAKIINKCINIMGQSQYNLHKNKIEKEIQSFNSSFANINEPVHKIIRNWLKNKNKNKVNQIIHHNTQKNIIYPITQNHLAEPLCFDWVETYIELAKTSNISNYEFLTQPSIQVVNDTNNQNTLGSYQKSSNVIVINTHSWKKNELIELYDVIFNEHDVSTYSSKLQSNPIYQRFFTYRFPSSTLPHELEHYRRQNTHESYGHNSTTELLYPGDFKSYRSFDQVTNTIYQHVLSNGFLQIFSKKLREKKKKIMKMYK